MTLPDFFTKNIYSYLHEPFPTDKHSHNYLLTYDEIFAALAARRWRKSPCRIGEIGVSGGNSIKLWLDYAEHLRIPCAVHGYDLDPSIWPRTEDYPNYHFHRGDAYASIATMPQFDLLIDDGDHRWESQEALVAAAASLVSPRGYLVIEDVKFPFLEDLLRKARATEGFSVDYRHTLEGPIASDDNNLVILRRNP
jgi:hypothetical protein